MAAYLGLFVLTASNCCCCCSKGVPVVPTLGMLYKGPEINWDAPGTTTPTGCCCCDGGGCEILVLMVCWVGS